MVNFNNKNKIKFLDSIPTATIISTTNTLTYKSKFNFSYMDFYQEAAQKFSDWPEKQLLELLNKLYHYSAQPLQYWKNQKIGSGKHRYSVLEVYGSFPSKSDFVHPKHVPHEAMWSRFRLDSDARLIGFVVPSEFNKKEHITTKFLFDTNTFYVVFLDIDHRFYIPQKK